MSLFTIALAGNPNTGKTTLFNRLTGLRQRTANYPGVTVEQKKGAMEIGGETSTVIDLPGCYSLDANSLDERVVIDVLTGRSAGTRIPDVMVVVVDASNARRNLFLASQISEFGIPMVLVFNQWDVVQKRGLRVDVEKLSRQLSTEIIPMNAKRGLGVQELKAAILRARNKGNTLTAVDWPREVELATRDLQAAFQSETGNSLSPFLARRILFDNSTALAQRFGLNHSQARQLVESARKRLLSAGMNPSNAEAILRYRHLSGLMETGFAPENEAAPRSSDAIDRVLCHRVWGMVLFLGLMLLMFQSVYFWAGPLMDGIDSLFGAIGDALSPALASTPMLQSLVVDGIIAGVGGVVIFLPQIFILFLFIGLLEDTGYMARAAFIMDKIFGWCGLNGKCFIPLLSSYACAVPGILSARTIDDPKARLATVFIAPMMSCSARLPVYALFIGAFIEPIYGPFIAGLALFGMHFVGLAVAVPVAALLNRYILKTPPQPFVLEMPSYKAPEFKDLMLRIWIKGKEFLTSAGTIIFAFSILIWALLYFPHPEQVEKAAREDFITQAAAERSMPLEALQQKLDDPESDLYSEFNTHLSGVYLEQSYLARLGKWIQPVFDPAGFDWKITIGILGSFPARELIVSTLGIIYHLGAEVDEESDDLRQLMKSATWQEGPRQGQPVYTLPTALAVMVFFALCLQCGATVATIGREIGGRWAFAAFAFMTTLGWVCAVAVYQVGSLLITG